MSLEFYCRWSSTVTYKEIFKNYLEYWGSIVSVEFFRLWSSTIAIPFWRAFKVQGFPPAISSDLFVCDVYLIIHSRES